MEQLHRILPERRSSTERCM